jgi:hypothetical protein
MAMTLITTNSGTNQASMIFNSSIDSTYKLYIFKWYDVNPATDAVHFVSSWATTAHGAGSYGQNKVTSAFQTIHYEDDSSTSLAYSAGDDLANASTYQILSTSIGNGGDESSSGELYLFNPSNTTYVTHFYSRSAHYHSSDAAQSLFISGYCNGTAAVDDIKFYMTSGNFDGTMKMYGVA